MSGVSDAADPEPTRTIGQWFSKEAAKCLEGEDEGTSKHSVMHGSAPSNMTALLRMSTAWGVEKPWIRERILSTVSGKC